MHTNRSLPSAMPKKADVVIFFDYFRFERKADKQVNHLKDGNSDKTVIRCLLNLTTTASHKLTLAFELLKAVQGVERT
jgi:hypothetical protein